MFVPLYEPPGVSVDAALEDDRHAVVVARVAPAAAIAMVLVVAARRVPAWVVVAVVVMKVLAGMRAVLPVPVRPAVVPVPLVPAVLAPAVAPVAIVAVRQRQPAAG